MKIRHAHIVAFSPCGTTLACLRAIAAGFGFAATEHDLTLPAARKKHLAFGTEDIVLMGFPVYGGRLPHNAGEIFACLTGSKTPAVLAAVYGNREYEDALLEMQREGEARGFVTIAAATPVAQHSMEPEVATDRPDAKDALLLARFGRAVALLAATLETPQAAGFVAPGVFPYRKPGLRINAAPKGSAGCTTCGVCAGACPAGAIGEDAQADDTACILCMACVKACPTLSRVPTHPNGETMRAWLREHCAERKKPGFFPENLLLTVN